MVRLESLRGQTPRSEDLISDMQLSSRSSAAEKGGGRWRVLLVGRNLTPLGATDFAMMVFWWISNEYKSPTCTNLDSQERGIGFVQT